jgi:hypothetical protein
MFHLGRQIGYQREGDDLDFRGFYLDVSPWKTSVFSLTEVI